MTHLHQEAPVIDDARASRRRREYGAPGRRAVVVRQLTCIVDDNPSRRYAAARAYFVLRRVCRHDDGSTFVVKKNLKYFALEVVERSTGGSV